MKVDLGTCAVCGAKNSKFVESCYKCGAKLPWAPGYVAPKTPAPKPAPQPAPKPAVPPSNPQPRTTPQNVPPANDVKTVFLPPADTPGSNPGKPSPTGTLTERANQRVPIPAWAIAAGVVGCLALGMALMMSFGHRPQAQQIIIVPTPVPGATPAVVPTPAPATTALPTTAATPVTSITATPLPSTAPTLTPTLQPSSAPTTAPTIAATVAPTAALIAANGPAFDTLFVNTSTGTAEQKAAYWKTVVGTKVSWRGDFVKLGSSPSGPVTISCKHGTTAVLVNVDLSTSPAPTLPHFQPNQSIAIEGILKSYSPQGYELSQGRIS